jgi:hypothetical protein
VGFVNMVMNLRVPLKVNNLFYARQVIISFRRRVLLHVVSYGPPQKSEMHATYIANNP